MATFDDLRGTHGRRQWGSWLQIWKYQPWMKTLLLSLMRTLEASPKPIIAIHVKAHGNTPVQKHLAIQPQDYIEMFASTFPHVRVRCKHLYWWIVNARDSACRAKSIKLSCVKQQHPSRQGR